MPKEEKVKGVKSIGVTEEFVAVRLPKSSQAEATTGSCPGVP